MLYKLFWPVCQVTALQWFIAILETGLLAHALIWSIAELYIRYIQECAYNTIVF